MSEAQPNAPDSLPAASKVRIKFTSNSAEIDLPSDLVPIAVPTDARRQDLSQIVNHLLDNAAPTPFAFLSHGTFLTKSIEDHLSKHRLSEEEVLVLETVYARLPPPHVASFPHDDWISAVDVLSTTSPANFDAAIKPGSERILTASYDGIARIWDTNGRVVAATKQLESFAQKSLKAVGCLNASTIVTGAMDRAVRIYSLKPKDLDANATATLHPKLALYGHKQTILSLSVSPKTNQILSASADHTAMLWSASSSASPAADETLLPRSYKRTTSKPPTDQTSTRGPLTTLKSHTAPVSAAIFDPSDKTVAYTSSWDHVITTFDLTTAKAVSRRETAAQLHALCAVPRLGLLAAGSAANYVALVDVRADSRNVSALTLAGHRNKVTALAAEPGEGWGLVSAGADGVVKLWDLRAVGADEKSVKGGFEVNSKTGEKGKSQIFGLSWDRTVGVVSGGEDKKVHVYRQD